MSTERCPDCFKPITINGLFCENLCRLQRENQRNALTSGNNMLQRMLEAQKTRNLSSGDRYVLQMEAWITKAANGQIDYEKLLLEDIELWDGKNL